MFKSFIDFFYAFVLKLGATESFAQLSAEAITFISLVVLAIIAYYISWYIIKRTVIVVIHRSQNSFDDILVRNRVISRASYFVPSFIINKFAAFSLPSYPIAYGFVHQIIELYVIFVWMILIGAIISSLYDFYNTLEVSKKRPVKGFAQVLKLIVYIIGGLLIIANLVNKDISSLFIGLGTLSAVLMLIFKDPILGFVGGLQLTLNDMVNVGDWISMPKYGADGDVLDITLTTVKVQNWDKTITTIPTYALVSDSFTNWRGMEMSGGRRVKRSINIDMESVKFCTPDMLQKYQKYQLISNYISDKEEDIRTYNAEHAIDESNLVNGRRQTNLGVFRAYLKAYLRNHPKVHQDMTLLVRHLQPSEKGIPVELYFFSNRQAWAEYEDIQGDVFDHVLAIIPMFDLRVFQVPSGGSLEKAIENMIVSRG